MVAEHCLRRLRLCLSSACLLLAILSVAGLGLAAHSVEYKPFVLNTVSRDMGLAGSLSFTVLNGGSIEYSGGSVSVAPGDFIEIVISDTDLEARLWIGVDGWIDIEDLVVVEVRVNGVTVVAGDEIEADSIRVDVDGMTSSLEVFVTSSTNGWTLFTFNGTSLINGNDNSDILLSGARPGPGSALNINIEPSSQYASGTASTAYVNGTEVPEFSPIGLVALALAGLLILVKGLRAGYGRSAGLGAQSLRVRLRGLAGVG